jgi:hypothetical protein
MTAFFISIILVDLIDNTYCAFNLVQFALCLIDLFLSSIGILKKSKRGKV